MFVFTYCCDQLLLPPFNNSAEMPCTKVTSGYLVKRYTHEAYWVRRFCDSALQEEEEGEGESEGPAPAKQELVEEEEEQEEQQQAVAAGTALPSDDDDFEEEEEEDVVS